MADPKPTQIFIKLFDNQTLTLHFPSPQITPRSILNQIQCQFPVLNQTLTVTLNGKFLSPTDQTPQLIPNFSTLNLHAPLLGGKGGFGSLLRGSGTKAGQKKTNNFDACRDMSGRRLRHVNNEKKIEEWKAEEEERKLEKMAAKYINQMNAKGKGGKKEAGADKYVEEYRAVSARCVEEVERSVREAAIAKGNGKGRKRVGAENGKDGDAKKLKIWMGKRKVGESDSDDSDSDSENDDSDTENEKSAVIDNGSLSDSSKDASSGSMSVQQRGGDLNGGGSFNSGSEENETVNGGCGGTDATTCGSGGQSDGENPLEVVPVIGEKTMELSAVEMSPTSDMLAPQLAVDQAQNDSGATPDQTSGDPEVKLAASDEGLAGDSNVPDLRQPLNFDDFSSATELEALGLERLKSELQPRGLKCGGSLQERAARLFLLKTTALENLPKKLFAKK